MLLEKKQQGDYHHLVSELQLDDGEKFQSVRLTREEFAEFLHFVPEDLQKHCLSREVICPRLMEKVVNASTRI